MKKISFILVVFTMMLPLLVEAQRKPNYVGQWYQRSVQGKRPETADLLSQAPSDFARTKKYNLRANVNQLNSIIRTTPPLLNLTVPYGDKTYTLNLARVELTAGNMNVRTNQGNARYTKGVQYRGIVDGNPAHIASLSLTPGDITGFFSTDEGNFVITKEGLEYIVYNDQVLEAPGMILCSTPDTITQQIPTQQALVTGIGCKTVQAYLECDYNFFQTKGSDVNAVADYVIGFFNQVATLYANENVAVQISEIFVWTSPDPYMSYTSTTDVLSAFRTNRGSTFNGHLAHFLSTRSLGGGVAYVDVICNKAYAYGVSQVYSYYNNFPTYSWTVEVVAHEMGHNMGSPHTHSCSWSGGALDNCYTPEGSCAAGPTPIGGGTVMSYCHMTSLGINFNYGFGYEPGNRIRDRVLNASCIPSGSNSTPPTSLYTTNITTSAATLNWVAVAGANSYTVQYRPSASSSWTSAGTTSATSVNLSGLAANTGYVWNVKSDCSAWSAESSFTTTGTAGCSAPGGLTTGDITQNSATLSWSPVSGAANYTVQYAPSGTTNWATLSVTSSSTSISGLSAGSSYTWQVKADCSPYSAQANFITQSTEPPPPPPSGGCTAATGLTESNVTSSSATLSWTGAVNADRYQVRIREAGARRWSNYNNVGTNSLNVSRLKRQKTYEWMVDTQCSDGTSSGFSATKTFTTQ